MKVIFTLLLSLFYYQGGAQPKIEMSDNLSVDYRNGLTTVVLLDNGSTFLLHQDDEDEGPWNVKLFNPERNLVGNVSIAHKGDIITILKMKSELVLFFTDSKTGKWKQTVLHRVRIDNANGKKLGDDILQVIDHRKNRTPQIKIEKDYSRDDYVITFEVNGKRLDYSKRVWMLHFNAQHEQINTGRCLPREIKGAKYYHVIGTAIDGDRRTFVITYESLRNGPLNGTICIHRFNKGDTIATKEILGEPEYFRRVLARANYNSTKGTLDIFLRNYVQSVISGNEHLRDYYETNLYFVDPLNLRAIHTTPIVFNGIEDRFLAPFYAHYNKDNSISVLFHYTKSVSVATPKTVYTQTITNGEFGIVKVDAKGAVNNVYRIKKDVGGIMYDNMLSELEKKGLREKSKRVDLLTSFFLHVNAGDKDYLIFNDKYEMLPSYYLLHDGKSKIMPLLPRVEKGMKNRFLTILYADVNNGTFVSLLVEDESIITPLKKYAPPSRLIWVKFE